MAVEMSASENSITVRRFGAPAPSASLPVTRSPAPARFGLFLAGVFAAASPPAGGAAIYLDALGLLSKQRPLIFTYTFPPGSVGNTIV